VIGALKKGRVISANFGIAKAMSRSKPGGYRGSSHGGFPDGLVRDFPDIRYNLLFEGEMKLLYYWVS
jgi:hypothetical protein